MEEDLQPKSWFGRNWKWVVPAGGCMIIIILFAAFAGSLILGVTSLMSDSQAYQDAMTAATNNSEVIQVLGEPIETDGMAGGSINYSGGFGEARLSIPIKGPKASATIYVSGEGVEENWNYDRMEVFIKDSDEVIDLLGKNDKLIE
jgi:hypothetical protein